MSSSLPAPCRAPRPRIRLAAAVLGLLLLPGLAGLTAASAQDVSPYEAAVTKEVAAFGKQLENFDHFAESLKRIAANMAPVIGRTDANSVRLRKQLQLMASGNRMGISTWRLGQNDQLTKRLTSAQARLISMLPSQRSVIVAGIALMKKGVKTLTMKAGLELESAAANLAAASIGAYKTDATAAKRARSTANEQFLDGRDKLMSVVLPAVE